MILFFLVSVVFGKTVDKLLYDILLALNSGPINLKIKLEINSEIFNPNTFSC